MKSDPFEITYEEAKNRLEGMGLEVYLINEERTMLAVRLFEDPAAFVRVKVGDLKALHRIITHVANNAYNEDRNGTAHDKD